MRSHGFPPLNGEVLPGEAVALEVGLEALASVGRARRGRPTERVGGSRDPRRPRPGGVPPTPRRSNGARCRSGASTPMSCGELSRSQASERTLRQSNPMRRVHARSTASRLSPPARTPHGLGDRGERPLVLACHDAVDDAEEGALRCRVQTTGVVREEDHPGEVGRHAPRRIVSVPVAAVGQLVVTLGVRERAEDRFQRPIDAAQRDKGCLPRARAGREQVVDRGAGHPGPRSGPGRHLVRVLVPARRRRADAVVRDPVLVAVDPDHALRVERDPHALVHLQLRDVDERVRLEDRLRDEVLVPCSLWCFRVSSRS